MSVERERHTNEETVTDFITQNNMLDYMATYMSIYRAAGPQLMADLLHSIQYRFDKDYRRCHYGI